MQHHAQDHGCNVAQPSSMMLPSGAAENHWGRARVGGGEGGRLEGVGVVEEGDVFLARFLLEQRRVLGAAACTRSHALQSGSGWQLRHHDHSFTADIAA
eukprot:474560-Rhodomonas_salina.2